jgi:hypothetical protein
LVEHHGALDSVLLRRVHRQLCNPLRND